MATEEIYQDDLFVIYLTIEGTEYEEVEVEITNLCWSIREMITRILSVFKISKFDENGIPFECLLGQVKDEGGESTILEFEDGCGRELTLLDYNVHSGDHLRLIRSPLCGSLFADLYFVTTSKILFLKQQKLKECCFSPHGFPARGYVDYAIERVCKQFNLGDSSNYYLTKVSRVGYNDICLKYLERSDKNNEQVHLDDYFQAEDWILTEKPVLFLAPYGYLSRSIYNKLKKIYNRKRQYIPFPKKD